MKRIAVLVLTVALLLAGGAASAVVKNGSPDDDAWESDEGNAGVSSATSDDPNTVDLDLDEDDDADVPADDPWTSGAPALVYSTESILWATFLAQHAKEIPAGQKIKVAALVGCVF